MAEFIYQPLPGIESFRVLILEPGHSEDDIKCRLELATLASYHSFEAISYAWGDFTPGRLIYVDRSSFQIRRNLFHALHAFRSPTLERALWADAICINQDDIPERNQQVSIMRQIYERSQTTLIWLDGVSEVPPSPLKLLTFCGHFLRDKNTSISIMRRRIAETFFESGSDQENLDFVSSFFSAKWFKRAWVQQECMVSTTVLFICGERHFSLEVIDLLILSILSAKDDLGDNLKYSFMNNMLDAKRLIDMRNGHIAGDAMTLSGLIMRICGRTIAGDPRDSIFSLIGLVNPNESLQMKADYGLTVREVFTSAVEQAAQDGMLLPIISLVATHPIGKLRSNLPSWTPDFNSRYLFLRSLADHELFCAGGKSGEKELNARFDANKMYLVPSGKYVPSILVMSGKFVDSVSSCLQYWKRERSKTEQAWYQQCRKLAEQKLQNYDFPAGESLSNCWFRLLVQDNMTTWEKTVRASTFFRDLYLEEKITHPVYIPDCKFSEDLRMAEAQRSYLDMTRRSSLGANFCISEKGRLGWIPLSAREGDRICIFAGGRSPWIVRARSDGTYELIGDCYIHGIMYGEAVNEIGCDWQDIRLT